MTRSFATVYEYHYNECEHCGHVFCEDPTSQEAVQSLYRESTKKPLSVQADIYCNKEIFQKRLENISMPKALFADTRINSKGKWVDIGSGVGDMVIAASSLGWDATGIESDPVETAFAQSMGAKIENVFLDAENLGKYLGKANIVSVINVLEHIIDPLNFMIAISKAISSGTYVLIEVPRHPSLSSLAIRVFPNYSNRHIYPPDHLHAFSEMSLAIILRKSSLMAKAIWFFGQDVYELFMDMALQGDLHGHPLLEAVLTMTPEIQKIVDCNELSDTMLLLAEKIPEL